VLEAETDFLAEAETVSVLAAGSGFPAAEETGF